MRDEVVDYVRYWSARSEVRKGQLVKWAGLASSKFYDWQRRYGQAIEHNAKVPRDHWLEQWERDAIVRGFMAHPEDGYRRLTYTLMDADVVAVSPSTTYRVLKRAGLLRQWNAARSAKGTGFRQPTRPHEHWHIDISYINIRGTFYYLCSILDGASRYLVHWELRESMRTADVEIVLQRAREKFPSQRPRIISDNGPQFIAKDFKEFIRVTGMSHVRTSPYYPQSNGKLERWHKTLKRSCIRPNVPLSLDDARRQVEAFVAHYNESRLHSSIGYVTPRDKLLGRDEAIFAARDLKLVKAREQRAIHRQAQRCQKQPGEGARREVQEGANERLLETNFKQPAPVKPNGHRIGN